MEVPVSKEGESQHGCTVAMELARPHTRPITMATDRQLRVALAAPPEEARHASPDATLVMPVRPAMPGSPSHAARPAPNSDPLAPPLAMPTRPRRREVSRSHRL